VPGHAAVQRKHERRYDFGHAWAVFDEAGNTDPDNTWVIDPAQGFVGTKLEARQRGLPTNYYLETDRRR
jgi:hypothetical protein